MKHMFGTKSQQILQKKQTNKDDKEEEQQQQQQQQQENTTVSFYSLSLLQAASSSSSVYSILSLPRFFCEKRHNPMEKQRYGFLIIFSVDISLGLVSFVSCIVAESKKAKKKDFRLDNELCYLPQSPTFGFGLAALTFLVLAQILGNFIISSNFWSRNTSNSSKAKKPTIATTLLVLSWISFGLGVILLSAATTLSRTQSYGKGWLDQDCYVVKDGVYVGSGFLVLVTIGSTLCSAVLTIRKSKLEQAQKVHAQAVE